MRRRLAFVFTAVALIVPVARLFLMAWPFLLQGASIAIDSAEVIGSAIASGLVGCVVASHIHRERGTRL
jgi:hypothetical protein